MKYGDRGQMVGDGERGVRAGKSFAKFTANTFRFRYFMMQIFHNRNPVLNANTSFSSSRNFLHVVLLFSVWCVMFLCFLGGVHQK